MTSEVEMGTRSRARPRRKEVLGGLCRLLLHLALRLLRRVRGEILRAEAEPPVASALPRFLEAKLSIFKVYKSQERV